MTRNRKVSCRCDVVLLAWLGTLMLLLLVGTASGAPPIACRANSTSQVLVRDRGADQLLTVGRPTPELYQYLLGKGYHLPDITRCFLVLDAGGKPVQDMGVVCRAADTYHFADMLLNGYFVSGGGVDLDQLISGVQTDVNNAQTTVNAAYLTESVEFIRDTDVSFMISVATEDPASFPVFALKEAGGYVADLIVDGLVFDKKAQRTASLRHMILNLDGARARLDLAQRAKAKTYLICDSGSNDPQRLFADFKAIQDGAACSQFITWYNKVWNFTGLVENLENQGIDIANSVVAGFVGEYGAKGIGDKAASAVAENFLSAVYSHTFPITLGVPYKDQTLFDFTPIQIQRGGLQQMELARRYYSTAPPMFHTIDQLEFIWEGAVDSGLEPEIRSNCTCGTELADFLDAMHSIHQPGSLIDLVYQMSVKNHWFQESLIADYFSPGPITDLAAQVADYTSVNLTWTAPADDSGAKGVANHEICYSDAPIVSEGDWNKASGLGRSTGPASIGQAMTVNAGDLQSGAKRYFAVRAVDDQGNRGPISNSPFVVVGSGVNPISLKGDSVCPNPGSAIVTCHGYFVTYTHQGGTRPSNGLVYINGTPHSMSSDTGAGNPKDGLYYHYYDCSPYASGSTVSYHFEFTAGRDTKRLPATGELQLSVDSMLYGSTVSPASADGVVLRTFQVWYRNPTGAPATRSQLRFVNSTPMNMRLVRGAPTIGALYEAAAWVSLLNKDYWFDFSDGTRDFRLPSAGSYSVGVTSNLDVAVIACAMPTNVTCGQVIPVRPQLRNVGTVLAQNCDVYFSTNGVSVKHVTVPVLEPGMTRSGAAAFDWAVAVSDVAQSCTVRVGITPLSGEGVTSNNEMAFTYNVPPGKGTIVGDVYDSTGVTPIAGAVVQAFYGTYDAGHALSDSIGHFVIDGLVAGIYKVHCDKDGQQFDVQNVAVPALQTANLGLCKLVGVPMTQYTSLSVGNAYSPRVSPYDGAVACYVSQSPSGFYLMKADGSNFHDWLTESPRYTIYSYRDSVSFSPTRREFVFAGTRTAVSPSQTGVFRCVYDANANFVSITRIVDRNGFANQIYNPQFMPDGETIIFYEATSDGAIWQVSRDGSGLQKRIQPANLHGFDNHYTVSPNGSNLVNRAYVYRLDLTAGLLTNVWSMPPTYGSSIPTFSPDGRRVQYVYTSGVAPSWVNVFSAEVLSDEAPIELTFERLYDSDPCLSPSGTRLYFGHNDGGGHANLWSRDIHWPEAYGYGFVLCNGISINSPITLDGDGTNESCTLSFRANTNGLLSAKVYDCQNRLVRSISQLSAVSGGSNAVTWDAKGDDDLAVPLGVYTLRIDLQAAGGSTNAPFSYRTYVPVVYEMANLGGMGWLAFAPDDKSLYYVGSSNSLWRLNLQSSTSTPVNISNVYSFDVNATGVIAAHTNTDGVIRFVWYTTNGVPLGTWVAAADWEYDGTYYRNYPSAHPNRQEFIFGDTVVADGMMHANIYKATGPSSVVALTTSTNVECLGNYSPDGSSIIYTVTTSLGSSADSDHHADIYEMGADGAGQTRRTFHPGVEMWPRYVANSSRMLFKANWASFTHELWSGNTDGSNPWWLLPSVELYSASYDITKNADLLAVNYGGAMKLISLPEHLNKGSIHGRVVDDHFAAGLADVSVRAVQGTNVAAATRSNSKGYFKLINLTGGSWSVVAGGGSFLQTTVTNVSVGVAQVAEVGSIAITPVPTATLSDPAANSLVAPLFAVKAELTERCAYAQFQWRRTTNDTWTTGATLASSNQCSVTFSATAVGWADGSYFLRAVGVNSNAVADPNPVEVTVAYKSSISPLTLTLDTSGTNLFALRTTKPSATNDLAVMVYEVKYGSDTNWLTFGTTVSTNAADKQFEATLVPLGMATQYRVKNYDSLGNVATSSVVSLTRTIPGDTDNDGIPDSWMVRYFGHPTGQAGDHSMADDNPAGDGLSNLQKYLLGLNPLVWDNLWFGQNKRVAGGFDLEVYCAVGSNYVLRASTNLVNWTNLLNFSGTNWPMHVVDPGATNYSRRFYRAVLQ